MRAAPFNQAKATTDLADFWKLNRHRMVRICECCGCSEHNACCRMPDGSLRETGCHWISVYRCSECEAETPKIGPDPRARI